MFKRLASEALGISDIGTVVSPQDYDKVEAEDYVMHEEGERIYFLIKSKMDEYCFTNLALIHVDGDSALSSKRMLKRFDYKSNTLSNVYLETAGTVDMDVEIKFHMGDESYSIDVNKNQIEQLKDLYKALLRIASVQKQNAALFQYAESSLSTAATSVGRSTNGAALSEQFQAINEYSFNWISQVYDMYHRKDFGEVFEKFINN